MTVKDSQERYIIRPVQIAEQVKRVCVGVAYTVFETLDGHLYAWGDNHFHQASKDELEVITIPKQIPIPKNVTQFSCGYDHNLALTVDNELYEWGKDVVDINGVQDISIPRKVNLPTNVKLKYFAAGAFSSWVVTESNEVYFWGYILPAELYGPTVTKANTSVLHKDESIEGISISTNHVILWTNKNQIYALGNNKVSSMSFHALKSSSTHNLVITQPFLDRISFPLHDLWNSLVEEQLNLL